MHSTHDHVDDLPEPIRVLEEVLAAANTTVVEIAFENSFFVHPEEVRARCPYFPGFARKSNQHYPNLNKGAKTTWLGRDVVLDLNHRAQAAWAKYTGRSIARKSGYGVRHIWGNPWDPDAFTAGWNLCYMPFWVGMLTEEQHPHPLLERAIRQASFDLFFRNDPVCNPPAFVEDPGLDLAALLKGRPLRLLRPRDSRPRAARHPRPPAAAPTAPNGSRVPHEVVREIRSQHNKSWKSLQAAVRLLLGEEHQPFNSSNVESTAKSTVRKMAKRTGLGLADLRDVLDSMT